ncbi:MAG: hypothetical protein M3P11_04235 [Actinomycetota bacterium]|nr:hypothetical protein [Actinomycetota bacterium]
MGTLEEWAYRRTGPKYLRLGRHARYRIRDVEAWLESCEVPRAVQRSSTPPSATRSRGSP